MKNMTFGEVIGDLFRIAWWIAWRTVLLLGGLIGGAFLVSLLQEVIV